jgi:hypothetical protein
MSDISDLVKQIIVPQQSDSFTNSTEIDYTDHDSISQLASQILVPEQPPTPVERNPLMDIPTAAIAGVTDLAEIYARAYQGGDIPGSETETIEGQRDPLNQFANWLIQNKDTFEKKHPYIYAPTKDEGTVRKWFREGARSVIPSLGASVPSAIAGGLVGGLPGAIIGYAGGGATIFGLAEYNRFLQDVQKYNAENPDKAIPPEVYMDEAFKSAVLEGGLEGINDLIEAGTFGVGRLITKPMKSTIKEILGQGLKEGTKTFLKGQAVLQPSEMLTEAAQNYSETALRNELGVDNTDPKDAALAALGPTFFSTLIMGGGAHAYNIRQNSKIAKALTDPETEFDARFDAMRTIYKELQKQDKVNNTSFANTWGKVAQYKLLNNEAININEALSEVKPLETILKDKAVTNQLNEDVAKFDERGKPKVEVPELIPQVEIDRQANAKTIVPTGHTLETRQVIYDSLINKGFSEERANELASKIMGAKEAPVTPVTKLVNTEILDEFGKNIQKEVPLDSTNETIKLTPGESILSNLPEGLRNQFVYKKSGGLFTAAGNVKAILKKQGLSKEYGPLLVAPGEWIGAPLSVINMIETMKGVTGKTIPQIITPVNTKSTERTEIPEADYNKVQPDDLSNKGIPFTNKISAQRAIIRQQKQFNAPEDFYEIVNIGEKQYVARPKKLVKSPVKVETARDIVNRRNQEYLDAVKVSDQDGISKLDEIIQNLKDEGHENTPAYKQTVQRRDIITRRIAREEKRRIKENENKDKKRLATEKQDNRKKLEQTKSLEGASRKEGETSTVVQEQSKAKQAVENLKAKVKEKEEQVQEKSIKDRLTARLITARLKLGENVSDETVAKFKTVAIRWSRNPETGKWEEHEPDYKRKMTEEEREKKEDIRNVLKAEAKGREQKTETQTKTTKEKAVDITKSQLFTPIEETKANLDSFTVLEPDLDRRMLRKLHPINFPNAFKAMINHAVQVNDGTIDFAMIENFIKQLETASKAGKLNSSFDTNVDKQLFDKRLGLVKAHLEQAREYISKHQKEMAKKREQAILERKEQRAIELEDGAKPLEEEDNEPFARISESNSTQILSIPQIQSIINTFKAKWINQPNTIVVKDRAELLTIADETLEQYIKETPDHVRMGGVLHHDTIFLIADELINRDDIIKTMIHEMVGHYGVAKTLGPEFNEVCVNVFNKFKDTPLMKKLIKDYDHYNPSERQGKQGLGAEFIAKMSEDRTYNPTFWEYLIQEVKRILNKMFGTEFTLPDSQIRALIMESNKFIEGKKDYGKVEDYFDTPVRGNQESPVPWAYSALLKGVQDNFKQMPAKVQSLRKWLGKFTKPEELKWMGVEQFFGSKLLINKDEFVKFLQSNQIELKEIHRGGIQETSYDTVAFNQEFNYDVVLDEELERSGSTTPWVAYIRNSAGEVVHEENFATEEEAHNWGDDEVLRLAPELEEEQLTHMDTGFLDDEIPNVPMPHLSADELLAEAHRLTPAQKEYLEDFMDRWSLSENGTEEELRNRPTIDELSREFNEWIDTQTILPENYRITNEELTTEYENWRSNQTIPVDDATFEDIEHAVERQEPIPETVDMFELREDYVDVLTNDQLEYLDNLIYRWESINGRRSKDIPTKWSGHQAVKGGEDYQEMQFIWNPSRPSDVNERVYSSNHWEEPNVIGHTRWSTFTDSSNRKIMVIQELQSDWLQDAKVKGFKDTLTKLPSTWKVVRDVNYKLGEGYEYEVFDEEGFLRGLGIDEQDAITDALTSLNRNIEGVSKAPFLENWHEVFMKRMIRYAAEKGFDGIAWSTGEQQIKLYESALRKHVKEIKWSTLNSVKKVKVLEHTGGENVLYVNSDGIITEGFRGTEGHNIAEVVGKELAIKIMGKITGSISGLDLKIGGKGMNVFYDERVPGFISKYIKQWGAKPEKITINNSANKPDLLFKATPEGAKYDSIAKALDFFEYRIKYIYNEISPENIVPGTISGQLTYEVSSHDLNNGTMMHLGTYETLDAAEHAANDDWKLHGKSEDFQQPGFYLTPEMKHDVIYKGQPLWNKQGIDQTKLLQDIEQKFDTTSGFVYGAGILLPSGNSLSSTKMHEDLIYEIQQQIPELKSKDIGTILKLLKGIRTRAFGKNDLYAEIPYGVKPTEAQYNVLEQALNKDNRSLTYDIVDEATQTVLGSGVVNTIQEFKKIFSGQTMSDVARWHKMGDVYGRRIVDFQDITPNTSKQELKDLFNDQAYALLKTMSMQLPKNLPSLTWVERYLLSPEFYNHPTIEKIVKSAIERHDRYYEIFNDLNNVDHQFNGEDNIIDLNIKLKHKGLSKAQIIKNETSEDYKKFEQMKDEIDTGEWKKNYSKEDTTTWEQHYRNKGVSNDVIELYKLHRAAYDKALELLITPMQQLVTEIERVAQRDNTKPKYPTFTTLDEQGQPIQISLKEVINRMGQLRGTYAPRIREIGDYVIKGKRFEKVVRYHKSNRFEAELLKRDLERKGYKVEPIHERERLPEDVYASLRIINTQKAIEVAMKNMHEKELDTELLAKFNEELIRQVADLVRMRGFRSSMITRGQGEVVRGYITDPNERFVRYINNIAAGIAKGEAAKKMFGLLAGQYTGEGKDRKKVDGIDPSTEHRAYETMTRYIEEQLRNTDTGDRIIGMVKSIATFKYLGLNPRSPVVNVLSLVTTVPMAIHTHAMNGKGSMIIIGKELIKAAKDYVEVIHGNKLKNKDEQAYMDEIKKKGYDTPQYTREALGTIQRASGKAWAKTMYWSMYIFGKSEQWIRGTTMLASYRLIKSKNKGMTEGDLRDKAHFVSNRAHGVYGKATQLAIGQGTGPSARLAQLLYTYQKFGHTYIQALYEAGVRKGNIKGFLYGLISPIILSGVAVLPFKDFWWKLISVILNILGIKDDPEKGFWDWIRKRFGKTSERIGRHGMLGAVNLDVSSSMSIGVGAPKNFYELLGVGGGVLNDYVQAKHFFEIGQPLRATEKILPTGIGNFVRAIRELNGVTTTSGARVWDDNGQPYIPSTMETTARTLGFRSAELATMGERTWETKREIKNYSTEHDAILEAYRNYIVSKGSQEDFQEIMDRIVEYNQGVIRSGKVNEIPLIKYDTLKRQVKQLTKPSKSMSAGLFQQ